MEGFVWCPLYKINVNPEAEENCPCCKYYIQKKDADEQLHLVCNYEEIK